MFNVLFAASECVPFLKTGGLADVAGSLPKKIDKKKFDVRVVMPKYMCIKDEFKNQMTYVTHFYMNYNGEDRYVGVLTLTYEGITFYFIDNEYYYSGDRPYGDPKWDLEKYGFFSKALLSALPGIGFRPDIIHCHDWQTGLVPIYLDHFRFANDYYRGIKTVMTIHNLKFQGIWDKTQVRDMTGLPEYYFAPDKMEAYQDANCLKGGIVYADRVTTVSQTYADEIKTNFYGERLSGLMNARSNALSGIVNGIDYDVFNPEKDPALVCHYSEKTVLKNKKKNKAAIQKELGLNVDPDVMLIGLVSRLTDQKGLDLVECVMDEMCQDYVQFAILGTGEERYENMFRHFAWKYPGKVSANIYYSEDLSHRIYSGCDAFLMPSLFEPCGLSQLMSLRYGTLPIVRETGGLKDTVKPYNEFAGTGTGFSFTNYNAHDMMGAVRYAEKIYYDDRKSWDAMVKRAMAEDFSWKTSAKAYEALYEGLFQ